MRILRYKLNKCKKVVDLPFQLSILSNMKRTYNTNGFGSSATSISIKETILTAFAVVPTSALYPIAV